MIEWDKLDARYYESGLDRGVLYLSGHDPIAWNGLTGVDEGDNGVSTLLYRDGIVYLADAEPTDFLAKITALFYPDEFHEALGFPEVTDGLYVDNQKPKRFNMAYRTLIGSGTEGDMFGYQIHLVYNCIASISQRSRKTLGASPEAVEFGFDIVCTPVKLPGYRPTAHYVIDTRNMGKTKLKSIENLLYGTDTTPGQMPTPPDLYDLMNFGDAMTFTVHQDKTFTVTGSSKYLKADGPNRFTMSNVNGTQDSQGNYTISDGGNTDVIIE